MVTDTLTTNLPLCYTSDIDECSSNSKLCHKKALCSNTRGSYKCTCNHGYSGDGWKSCLRELSSLFSKGGELNKSYKVNAVYKKKFVIDFLVLCKLLNEVVYRFP